MKVFLFAVAGLMTLNGAAHAQRLAVLGKTHLAVLDRAGTVYGATENAGEQRFLAALSHPLSQRPYEETLPLVAPPEWGKTIAGSTGEVEYQRSFAQGFVARLRLEHLAPHHTYLLTLNGTPGTPGNDLLPDPVPGLPSERFYDFLRVTTNGKGALEADLGIYLLPGSYHVRIYVKDTADFKIVLYRDYFDFVVAPDQMETKAVARLSP